MEEPRIPPQDTAKVEDTFVTLLGRGIDRIAEIQKHTIDIAAQQNAEMMDIYNKTAQKLPRAFRPPAVELAGTIFARFSDAQKHAIDLTVEQSHAVLGAVKERVASMEKSSESVVNRSKQAVEHTVDAQKKMMETAMAESKAVMEAARQQIGFTEAPADAAVSSFQRGVNTFVEAQKEILDLVAAR